MSVYTMHHIPCSIYHAQCL